MRRKHPNAPYVVGRGLHPLTFNAALRRPARPSGIYPLKAHTVSRYGLHSTEKLNCESTRTCRPSSSSAQRALGVLLVRNQTRQEPPSSLAGGNIDKVFCSGPRFLAGRFRGTDGQLDLFAGNLFVTAGGLGRRTMLRWRPRGTGGRSRPRLPLPYRKLNVQRISMFSLR